MNMPLAFRRIVGLLAALALILSTFGLALTAWAPQQAQAATLAEQIICFVDQQLGPDIPFDPNIDYCDSGEPPPEEPMPQCFDGIDNDGDGLIDSNDPGCSSPVDNNETDPASPAQCADGVDNDGDGLIDLNDPGCSNASDTNETNAASPATSTVTIVKYVDGVQATAGNADGASFGMQAQWSDPGIGTSSGSFNLNSAGSYMAVTSGLVTGEGDYATNEVLDGTTVGAACTQEGGPDFKLVGYSTGNTLAQAQAATPSTTSPSFVNLNQSKYVIVWNETCEDSGGEEDAPTLTLVKHAMGGNGTFTFNLTGTTSASRVLTTVGGWATSSPIVLGIGSTTISEVQMQGWNTTDISCVYGGESVGVQTSTSSEEISVDENDNVTCTFHNTASSTSTTTDAALHVDSIDAQKTTAIANDVYADGWRYLFHITTPNGEENLSMRFSDWVGQNASNTIAVANNMRVSSAQASNPGPVTLTAANAYSTPPFIMTTDLNPSMPGRQVEVLVEVKVPVGTQNDTYTTTYGVQTLP